MLTTIQPAGLASAESATANHLRELTMSHPLRTNSVAILGVLILMSAAINAQDRAADDGAAAEPAVLRIFHCNTPVNQLAQVLQQVGNRDDVTIVPEQTNNVLIVRAPRSAFDEIAELIERLNHPPRRITLSLTVLEVGADFDVENVDPAELLRLLDTDDSIRQVRKVRLSSLENNLAQVQLGEQRPVVSGESFGRSGIRTSMYQQEQLGTIVTMTARIDDDDRIVVELTFEMSRLEESMAGTESADVPVPPAKQTVTLQTTISVPAGEPVLITDFNSQDNPADTRLIGIVTATAE
jgi:type II secretory pathway component GspD/PulD (secretin)